MSRARGSTTPGSHLPAERIVALAEGQLSELEDRAARRHLEACAACAAELEAIEELSFEPACAAPRLAVGFRLRSPATPIAASASGRDEGLPRPSDGQFLLAWQEGRIELYGFDLADGYRLVLYVPDEAQLTRVATSALLSERRFPTGWVGRVGDVSGLWRVAFHYEGVPFEGVLSDEELGT